MTSTRTQRIPNLRASLARILVTILSLPGPDHGIFSEGAPQFLCEGSGFSENIGRLKSSMSDVPYPESLPIDRSNRPHDQAKMVRGRGEWRMVQGRGLPRGFL